MKLQSKDDDNEAPASAHLPRPPPPAIKRENSESSFLSKDRYKLWMLAALLLLAIWSLLTGTLTLKSTTASTSPAAAIHISDKESSSSSYASTLPDDLDVLEVAERQKTVERLWKAYIFNGGGGEGRGGRAARLPRFWEEAFQAAFDSLVSDSPAVRDEAVTEIAKMSLRSTDLRLPSAVVQSTTDQDSGGVSLLKLKLFR